MEFNQVPSLIGYNLKIIHRPVFIHAVELLMFCWIITDFVVRKVRGLSFEFSQWSCKAIFLLYDIFYYISIVHVLRSRISL